MARLKIGKRHIRCPLGWPDNATPTIMESLHSLWPRIRTMNRPLSGLRYPLPFRGGGGQGKGEEAISIKSRFAERTNRASSE